nr:hypothetical protein [uncultured Roseococcus sp.]
MHEVIVYQGPFEAWLWATTAGNVLLMVLAVIFGAAGAAFVIAWLRVTRRIEQTRRRIERDMRR